MVGYSTWRSYSYFTSGACYTGTALLAGTGTRTYVYRYLGPAWAGRLPVPGTRYVYHRPTSSPTTTRYRYDTGTVSGVLPLAGSRGGGGVSRQSSSFCFAHRWWLAGSVQSASRFNLERSTKLVFHNTKGPPVRRTFFPSWCGHGRRWKKEGDYQWQELQYTPSKQFET